MPPFERYIALIGARVALTRKIRADAMNTFEPDRLHSNPEKVMKVYGHLAKLDKEISELEDLFLGNWLNERGM